MRILMLSPDFPPYAMTGRAKHVYELSVALTQGGHSVTVLTDKLSYPERDKAEPYELMDSIEVYREEIPLFASSGDSRIPLLNLEMFRLGTSLMNKKDQLFDVIHVHDCELALAGVRLSQTYGIPLSATIHYLYGRHQDEMRILLLPQLEAFLINHAKLLICCSDFMVEELRSTYFLRNDKIRVVPNGIFTSYFKSRSTTKNSNPLVLYVGRIDHEKGVHTLLKAIPLVLSEVTEAEFALVGRGWERENLIAAIQEANLSDKIHFPGFLEGENLVRQFHRSSLVVYPSLYEPFGLVALEAMASSKPLIVSDTGGLREIVEHGKTGLRVTPEDPVQLARAIVSVLKEPDLAERLAEQAAKVVQKYDWKSVMPLFVEVYKAVIELPRTRSKT